MTTAKMIVDGKEVRVGTAKRNPADQFDFAVGARYAFDRLWEKQSKENETKRLGGFKIGDRVKYTNGESYIDDGKIGTVRDFWDGDIGVEFDDDVLGHELGLGENGYSCKKGHGWWCMPKHLTKITEEVKPRKSFKVGTRVKYIGVGKPNGLSGTICVYDENLPGVEFDKKFGGHNLDFGGSGPKCKDGHGWWCWTSDLEEITEETVGGFKVGDRVVCTSVSDRAYGKCGTVRVFWDNSIGVEFDESIGGHTLGNPHTDYTCEPGRGRWFRAYQLLHLHDPSAKTEFHVGDHVLCVEEDQRPYNRFGTVRYIDEENDEPRIGVEFDLDFHGHHLWFNGHKLLNDEHGWWCNTEWLVKLK